MDRKFTRVGSSTPRSSQRFRSTHTVGSVSIMGQSKSRVVETVLPPYNPEKEALRMREAYRKGLHLPIYSMWRYSSKCDIALIILGTILALGAGAHLPILIHFIGEFMGGGIDDERCSKILGPSGYKINLTQDYVTSFIRVALLAASTMTIFCYGYATCFAIAAENQIRKLRIAYYESMVRKEMSWLDNFVKREFGQHMTDDVTQIRAGIGGQIPYLLYTASGVISLLGLALYEEWRIALVLLCLAPIIAATSYLSSYIEMRQSYIEDTYYEKAEAKAEEILSNIKTVKVYDGEAKAIVTFDKSLDSSSKMWVWILLSAITASSLWFFVYTSYGVVFWFGNKYVLGGLRSETECNTTTLFELGDIKHGGPETLFITFFCVIYASLHIREISALWGEIKHARHIASEVFFMIDWVPRIDNMSRNGEVPSRMAIGKIEMDSVSFSYPRKPDMEVLHNINVTVHPGQVIAFVGGVGSGKSTILRLIQRLYDPTDGQIYLDGRSLESLNVGWYRSQIGILSQDPILFNRSVNENVRFAKWNSTLSEIQEACKTAGVHEDILQLNDGYETVVGHRGSALTETQRRQVSFARLVLQNPRIVILDDPIDPADVEFSESVLKYMITQRQNKTILISSSEVNTLVEQADKIYLLEEGYLLERGTHDDLMMMNGAYAALKHRALNPADRATPKFISQISAYRFAQSLRRMHDRRVIRMKEERRIESELSGVPLEGSADQLQSVNMLRNRRVQRISKGIRIAGGLMQFHYARPIADPNQLRIIYERGLMKMQKEKNGRRATIATSSLDSSMSHILNNMKQKKEKEPLPATPPLSPATSGILSTGRRKSSAGNQNVRFTLPGPSGAVQTAVRQSPVLPALPVPNTMEADNRSVDSRASDMFWNEYTHMLTDLEGVHTKTSLKCLLKLGIGKWYYVILTILAAALMGIYNPYFAYTYGELFEAVTIPDVEESRQAGNLLSFRLLALGTCAMLTACFQEAILVIGGYESSKRLRKKLFTHLLRQNMAWFDLPENDISFLCARLSSDAAAIENVVMMTLGIAVQSLSTTITIIALAYHIRDLEVVATVSLIIAIPIVIVIYIDGWVQLHWQAHINDILKDSTALEIELITNIRTVITLGLEDYFLAEFVSTLNKKRRKLLMLHQFRSIFFALSLGIPLFAYVILIYMYCERFVGKYEYAGRFSDVLKLGELVIFGIVPVGVGLSLLPNPKSSRGAAYRINRIFESHTEPEIENQGIAKNFENPPSIDVKDTSFFYSNQPDTLMLKSVSFNVQPSGMVALVGPTGSGKSLLINLLLRLYEPTSGTIEFDGMDTRNLKLSSTKKITSLVEQNPVLFDMTIRENIAYGDNSRVVPLGEIIEAAVSAEVHEHIMDLKHHYNTKLSSVDMGQDTFALRQRIVIARAILRNPKLLLIDEATTGSDFDSDLLLLRALDRCLAGRTTVVASQRIESIRNADLILVMNNGQFVEYGTDEELLSLRGVYFNMYMGQRAVEGYADNPETFARERINSLGVFETEEARRRRKRSSAAYEHYLQKRLTNYSQTSSGKSSTYSTTTVKSETSVNSLFIDE